MTSIDHDQVPTDAEAYGESAHAILGALSRTKHLGTTPSGMHTFEFLLTPEESGPVVRALMRAEAALLIADADVFEPAAPMMRTPGERRVDALLEIVTSAAAAVSN